MRKILFVAVVAVLVSACSTGANRIKGEYDFSSSSTKGLVVLSTQLVDNCGSIGVFSVSIYKNDMGFPRAHVPVNNSLMTHDFENGFFYVYEIDEGDYTIGNIFINGKNLVPLRNKKTDMLRFRAHKGRVTYLGQMGFGISSGCGSYTLGITDEWKRDAQLFENRIPNIPAKLVAKELAVVNNQ